MLALALANSPLSQAYDSLIHTPMSIRIGDFALDKTLLHWVNDGLMAIFFLLVGLEIKREFLQGELSTTAQAAMPFIAAIGGMVVPGLIYFAINADNAYALRGWAIPTATDIAFAVGVMSLLGSRVPPALKVFLLALAIIDDLGAIVIIAVFYTSQLSLGALSLAGLGIVGLIALNRQGRDAHGAVHPARHLHLAVRAEVRRPRHAGRRGHRAGHPADRRRPSRRHHRAPAGVLQHSLHPWVTFAILPLFAFANAGVSLSGMTPDKLLGSIPLGITLGLVVGKPLGVVLASALAVRFGRWPQARRHHVAADAGRRPARRHRLHHEPVHR